MELDVFGYLPKIEWIMWDIQNYVVYVKVDISTEFNQNLLLLQKIIQ